MGSDREFEYETGNCGELSESSKGIHCKKKEAQKLPITRTSSDGGKG